MQTRHTQPQQTKLIEIFNQHFDKQPQIVCAPGRVNLIGEHTDYNGGFVLPCAINYQTLIAFTPRDDNRVVAIAADYGNQRDEFAISESIAMNDQQFWSNYVRGVVDVMAKQYSLSSGVNMVISGNVPQGAGLSSSAALEVAVAKVISEVNGLDIEPKTLALIGQQAENEFVGCQCGIMDQLISACGQQQNALLIDCENLNTRAISMPQDSAVLIVNSNVKRGLVDSEYNTRRQQCEAAAKHFNVDLLRDVSVETFEAIKSGLDDVIMRRAKHVVYENQRTLDAADALVSGDLKAIGRLMRESHLSMKNDFEITTSEIDFLVELINHELGERGGARMTGGGFGGCVVALLPQALVPVVCDVIESSYQTATGLKESIYLCSAQDGVRLI